MNPLAIFAVVTVSLLLLFAIFGIAYLTCHQRRLKKEQEYLSKLDQERILPGAVQEPLRPKFNLREELA